MEHARECANICQACRPDADVIHISIVNHTKREVRPRSPQSVVLPKTDNCWRITVSTVAAYNVGSSWDPLEGVVSTVARTGVSVSVRLEKVTDELRRIQELLTSEAEVDGSILTDFRDAVNRVRNTAWAVEQFANSKLTETDPTTVLSVLAGERIRVAYQLCSLIEGDLANPDIQFQKGQLLQLREIAKSLEKKLDETVENR